jgi:molybdenum cofactor cytidylyltransferase
MIAAIILAAGESRRMGSPKARLPYPESDGTESTFLEHLLATFTRSGAEPIVVVLGHDAETLQRDFDFGSARVVVNRDYRDGMLSSIQVGIRALADIDGIDDTDIRGALVCPVDHPDVDPAVVDILIGRFEEEPHPVTLPVHGGRRGHPVLFSSDVFSELLAAPKTVGARQVVWDHQEDLLEVEVSDAGVTIDIDTPTDYRAFRDGDGRER